MIGHVGSLQVALPVLPQTLMCFGGGAGKEYIVYSKSSLKELMANLTEWDESEVAN